MEVMWQSEYCCYVTFCSAARHVHNRLFQGMKRDQSKAARPTCQVLVKNHNPATKNPG